MNLDEIMDTVVEMDAHDGVHKVKIDCIVPTKGNLETKQSDHLLVKGQYVDIQKTFINYIWLPRTEEQKPMFDMTIKNIKRQLGIVEACPVSAVIKAVNETHPTLDITLSTNVKDDKSYTNVYYYVKQAISEPELPATLLAELQQE